MRFKELREGTKPEFEVKYSKSKRGPIKVTKFMDMASAKKFLDGKKKEGYNGIISKGGRIMREYGGPKISRDEYIKKGKEYHKESLDEARGGMVRGKDGKFYKKIELVQDKNKVQLKITNEFGDFKTITLGQAARIFG